MILPSISFSPEQRPQPLKELRGRKTDARQDHFHNAHGVGVVQCHYIFSNLISNACTPFERRTNDIIHLFFISYEKICQKATIRKKELYWKAGQKKALVKSSFWDVKRSTIFHTKKIFQKATSNSKKTLHRKATQQQLLSNRVFS